MPPYLRVVEPSAIRCREVGRLNPVKSKHLLGDGFVLRKNVGVRASAGVGDIEQIKESCDLHLLGIVAGIGFREVEDEIGAAFGESEE